MDLKTVVWVMREQLEADQQWVAEVGVLYRRPWQCTLWLGYQWYQVGRYTMGDCQGLCNLQLDHKGPDSTH